MLNKQTARDPRSISIASVPAFSRARRTIAVTARPPIQRTRTNVLNFSERDIGDCASDMTLNRIAQWSRISSRCRARRERIVCEEVARSLDIPSGEEIVKESYAQMRNSIAGTSRSSSNTVASKESGIRSAVFGVACQLFARAAANAISGLELADRSNRSLKRTMGPRRLNSDGGHGFALRVPISIRRGFRARIREVS